MTGDHRFGCTGGAGSSCGGAIVQVDRPRMLSGAMLDDCGSAAKLSASSKGLLDPPYASTKRGGYNLLEWELDPFFFFARDEIVSDNNANPQHCAPRSYR